MLYMLSLQKRIEDRKQVKYQIICGNENCIGVTKYYNLDDTKAIIDLSHEQGIS